jgi:endogenous inhibitor of DNA gyrase (YacG/DUF329 family)
LHSFVFLSALRALVVNLSRSGGSLTRGYIDMRCPTCEREFQPADSAALPFCSDRCRLIDLGRWLEEGYALPEVTEVEDDETDGEG